MLSLYMRRGSYLWEFLRVIKMNNTIPNFKCMIRVRWDYVWDFLQYGNIIFSFLNYPHKYNMNLKNNIQSFFFPCVVSNPRFWYFSYLISCAISSANTLSNIMIWLKVFIFIEDFTLIVYFFNNFLFSSLVFLYWLFGWTPMNWYSRTGYMGSFYCLPGVTSKCISIIW